MSLRELHKPVAPPRTSFRESASDEIEARTRSRFFVLIGENVLNFHGDDDAYYEEWAEDLEDGWLIGMGFREHICLDWDQQGLQRYMHYGESWTDPAWRTRHPLQLYWMITTRFHPSLDMPEDLPSLNP